jgi:hypothetical protein
VLVLSPLNSQLTLLHQYLFTLARYDKDYDVRDRARYLAALTRGITAEEETDMGGVVLRREQIKLVLFVKAVVARKNVEMAYEVGTLSAVLNRKVLGYEALPEWTDDPTDGNLRESEVCLLLILGILLKVRLKSQHGLLRLKQSLANPSRVTELPPCSTLHRPCRYRGQASPSARHLLGHCQQLPGASFRTSMRSSILTASLKRLNQKMNRKFIS